MSDKKVDKMKELTDEEIARNEKHVSAGIRLLANSVEAGLKRIRAEGKIDEEGADAIKWLYNYAQDNNLTWSGVGKLIGMSTTFAYRVLHCDYQASYKKVVDTILKCKNRVEEEAKKKDIGFVKTLTAARIWEACDAALYDHMTAFVYGASQSGKTTALQAYQRTHNHGTTKYLRIGSHWSKARTVMELAYVCKCYSTKATTAQLEHRILDSINDRNLIIIDEFHELLYTSGHVAGLETIEFFRELYDRTGCGLVMAATPMGMHEFEEGRLSTALEQMRRRGLVKIVLPDVPKVADINRFAKSFELPTPEGDTLAGIKQILKSHGLGKFVKYLQKAYAFANDENRAMTWDDFAGVCNGYAELASVKNEY